MQEKTSFNFLNRMRLWQKFSLLGLFVAIAILLPYYQTIRTAQESIDIAQEELRGLVSTNATVKAIQLVQQHRGLSASVLSGGAADIPLREAKEKEIYAALAAIDAAVVQDGRTGLAAQLAKINLEYKTLADGINNKTTDTRKSFDAHVVAITNMLLFLEQVADNYKLSLDPTAGTYFLIQAATVHLPALTEFIGQGRAFGIGRLGDAKRLKDSGADSATAVTAADREKLANTLANIRSAADNTYRFLDKASAADPGIKSELDAGSGPSKRAALDVYDLARKEILETPAPSFDPIAYRKIFTEGLDSQFKFYGTVASVLERELNEQIADLRNKRLTATLLISAAALAALLVAFFTLRNVTGTVKSLQTAVDKVRAGDVSALDAVESRDEVGDLGRTVNSLLTERLASQQKAEKENDTLNNSVVSLLQTVFQLGNRDLTVRAEVTEDIIGTVSSSINQLTDETNKTLSEVQEIAEQVRQTSESVRVQSVMVEETARSEREALQLMSDGLNQATQQLTEVASLTEQSNVAAEQVTKATQAALTAVDGTVKGIDQLRDSISDMEKRFKRLGERSQEISSAVQLINNISERTHVLALNASMQAATAGEAGRGFAVVAEEVQRLSDSSRQATGQISQLVGNIQAETNETLFTVDRLIGEVVKQSELAQRAGVQMTQTQSTTAQLVGLVKQIASFSEQQAQLSITLQRSVLDMNQGTEQTSAAIAEQTTSTQTLANFSRRLTEAVGQFKLTA